MDLKEALQQHFGFTAFRPGQEQALQHILAGRDTLVVMPSEDAEMEQDDVRDE